MNNEPEIIALLGIEKTLQLERQLGGQRKYIAAKPTGDSPIVRVIGMEAAEKLATVFAGMLLYIPQSLLAKHRNEDIRMAVWAGEHKRLIGQRFGLVERTIRKIVEGDNHPRFGLSCRNVRSQVQGYHHGRRQRQQAIEPVHQHSGTGTPGHQTGGHPAQS